jgi:hypothetical protein
MEVMAGVKWENLMISIGVAEFFLSLDPSSTESRNGLTGDRERRDWKFGKGMAQKME